MLLEVLSGFSAAPQNKEKDFSLLLEKRRKRRERTDTCPRTDTGHEGLATAGAGLCFLWLLLLFGFPSQGGGHALHRTFIRIQQLVSWWWIAM